MTANFRRLLFGFAIVLLAVLPAQAARQALVIGNAAYAEGGLKNPVNDARAMDVNLDSIPATRFRYPTADEDKAALALSLDWVIRERAPAGWKGDETRERTVQNAIFPLLDKDRQATEALFDIIKHQPGY